MEMIFLPHFNGLSDLNFSLRIVESRDRSCCVLILFNIAWKYVEWMCMDLLSIYHVQDAISTCKKY